MLFLRNYDVVSDQVIDVRRAHCAWITEITDLQWCGTLREDSCSAVFRVAFEIDGDVDFHPAQQRGDLGITVFADIDELFECAFDAGAQIAAVVRPVRNRDRVETAAIVVFEHARHQRRCRVGM